MDAEECDAPLPIVESRRTGDDLENPTFELATQCAVLSHQSLAFFVGQGVPIVHFVTALRHRVEAKGALTLRRERRKQSVLQHLLGHTCRVLTYLGDRNVTFRDEETGRLDLGLKLTELPEVLSENH